MVLCQNICVFAAFHPLTKHRPYSDTIGRSLMISSFVLKCMDTHSSIAHKAACPSLLKLLNSVDPG